MQRTGHRKSFNIARIGLKRSEPLRFRRMNILSRAG
jgi:hypothetical protein